MIMDIRKNTYYDIYYNEDDPKESEKAARIRKILTKKGFEVNQDAHIGSIVCDQYFKTKLLKRLTS